MWRTAVCGRVGDIPTKSVSGAVPAQDHLETQEGTLQCPPHRQQIRRHSANRFYFAARLDFADIYCLRVGYIGPGKTQCPCVGQNHLALQFASRHQQHTNPFEWATKHQTHPSSPHNRVHTADGAGVSTRMYSPTVNSRCPHFRAVTRVMDCPIPKGTRYNGNQ